MRIFAKKETLTQNIAFMGVMTAINIALVALSYYVPVLLILMVILLPISSTLTSILCERKYYPIYLVATLGISILVTLNNFTDALLFVLPALVNGFLFGLIVDHKFSSMWTIISLTSISIGFFFAFVPLVNFVFNQNIIQVIASVFGLKDYKYLDFVAPIVVFFIALIQAIITYMLGKYMLKKLSISVNDEIDEFSPYIGDLISIILVLIFVFTYQPLSYLFLLYVLYFAIFEIIKSIIELSKAKIISIVVSIIIGFFIFGISYQYVPIPFGLLLLAVPFVLSLVTLFVIKCLIKYKTKVK